MKRKTIMVVDDDDEVREAVTDLLEGNGYAVIPASNGQEALKELRAVDDQPALILLDLMMPIMDGQTFCSEQRSDPQLKDIPVVVFSAFNAALGEICGEPVPRLAKPVRAEQLLESVDHFSDDRHKN